MKICPNCGTQLSSETRFCVKCGTDVTNVKAGNVEQSATETAETQETDQQVSHASEDEGKQAQQAGTDQQNEQEAVTAQQSNFSAGVKEYWEWLVSTWKAPFDFKQANKYFGLGTIIGENVVFLISIYIMINGFMRRANEATNGFLSEFTGDDSYSSSFRQFGAAFFFKTLIFLLLASFLMSGAAYYCNVLFMLAQKAI